ncbi:MAG: L,D-transpeptidase family protein [Anaerolineales bacterium]
MPEQINRRNFLKLSAASLASVALVPLGSKFSQVEFPTSEHLGRVVWWGSELKRRPSIESETIRTLREDEVLPWLRTAVGPHYERSQSWVETPEGYVWKPHFQPVQNLPNIPLAELPNSTIGRGMWVEVSIPYVDLVLANPPARSPWAIGRQDITPGLRLYCSQVVWVDDVRTDSEGNMLYRVNEPYGTYGDIFWAAAEAFRPITAEEITPISPDVEEKRILVDVARQTLHCYEGSSEVYFCRISSGALFDYLGNKVDAYETPYGQHPIWRKLISLHMSGGATGGGWDLPGIAWTTLFAGSGVAVHSTFWHNNYGVPMSHGCVNASPEDSKWVFRWTLPQVPYDPGDVTVNLPGGTIIEVVEA